MDERSKTSADNGRKGGRPQSEATIRAQLAREYISEQLQKSLEPIVAKAINDSILGDRYAREWLSSYAWGKPAINLGVDADGRTLKIVFDAAFNEATSETAADSE